MCVAICCVVISLASVWSSLNTCHRCPLAFMTAGSDLGKGLVVDSGGYVVIW